MANKHDAIRLAPAMMKGYSIGKTRHRISVQIMGFNQRFF